MPAISNCLICKAETAAANAEQKQELSFIKRYFWAASFIIRFLSQKYVNIAKKFILNLKLVFSWKVVLFAPLTFYCDLVVLVEERYLEMGVALRPLPPRDERGGRSHPVHGQYHQEERCGLECSSMIRYCDYVSLMVTV